MRYEHQELKDMVPPLRLLGREGYNLVDSRTYVTLASLHNYGVFSAGGVLIGTHAYGVLINQLGVRAATYTTEDIDIARREALVCENLPEQGFLETLRDLGIEFAALPQIDRKLPGTSLKQRGKTRFHVDQLVPSSNAEFPVLPKPARKYMKPAIESSRFLLETAYPRAWDALIST